MKRIMRIILIAVTVIGIFVLTIQSPNNTKALSNAFWKSLIKTCDKLNINTDTEWWNNSQNIRLLGHVIEYFILGLGAGISFKKKWMALFFCITISFLDQIAKIFVPVRHFDLGDIPFDIVGFTSAILIVYVMDLAIKSLKHIREVARRNI